MVNYFYVYVQCISNILHISNNLGMTSSQAKQYHYAIVEHWRTGVANTFLQAKMILESDWAYFRDGQDYPSIFIYITYCIYPIYLDRLAHFAL